MTNTAHLIEHTYHTSGKVFYIVECQDCLAVLNSGHHYSEESKHFAEDLAAKHNAEKHGSPCDRDGHVVTSPYTAWTGDRVVRCVECDTVFLDEDEVDPIEADELAADSYAPF